MDSEKPFEASLNALPFYIVSLSHATWDEAEACARKLPPEALPELRLDLFPELEAATMVHSLGRRCLVSCRRREEGGRWEGTEAERLARLDAALEARPAWVDLEWELEPTREIVQHRGHTRLLRSVHVPDGVFDLDSRLEALPEGDAFKWVGVASSLADNARLKPSLAKARNLGLRLSAFLMGPKGIPSRCLQAAWGGAFTYAAPEDGPPAAPGQLPLSTLWSWRIHRLNAEYSLCGVLGDPVLHSRGPAFHNARFQRQFKDLLYLPLQSGDPMEAADALEKLGILGASLTAPLKESLPAQLGMQGPLNTLWRRNPGEPWKGANTDAEALEQFVSKLAKGPVLILGSGGVASTSRKLLEKLGIPCLQASRKDPASPAAVASWAPVGIVQATSLGMEEGAPTPFSELLEAAGPSLRWAVEWIYKTDTAFAEWARERGLALIDGNQLFEAQAEAQSRHFIQECG